MELEYLEDIYPNAKCSGDKHIIEDLLPQGYYLFHIDSHNTEKGFRFQGCVLYGSGDENDKACNEMPLEVIKSASHYRIINNQEFLVWTIWFNI